MRSCMGVSLVAMTDYNAKEDNMTNSGDDSTTDFKPEGILNALMLVPPVSKYHHIFFFLLALYFSLSV